MNQEQKRLRRNILFAFCVGGAAAQPLGALIPILRDCYGFEYDLSGILLSCQSIGNLISLLLVGILPIYFGRRRSILFTSVWMAIAFGLLTLGVSAPALLIAICLMTGLSRGGTSNFCNTMTSTLPADRSTQNFNLLHGAYSIGALLSPLMLVVCMKLLPGNGWRILTGILFILCLAQIFVYATMPLPPETIERKIKASNYLFLKDGSFWLATAMLFCYISVEYAIAGWLVTYFRDTGLLSEANSQLMNSLLWLAIFLGRLAGSALGAKISKRTLLLVDGIGIPVFLVFMLFARSATLMIIGLTGVGLFMATLYPTAVAFGSQAIRGNDTGYSAMIFLASTGGVITPAVVGFIAQGLGIPAGMWFVAIITLLLLAVIVVSILFDRKANK